MKNRFWVMLVLFCGVKISYAQEDPRYKAFFSGISYKLVGASLVIEYVVHSNLKIDNVDVNFVLDGDTLPASAKSELIGDLYDLNSTKESKKYRITWYFLQNPYFKDGKNLLKGDLEIILTAVGSSPPKMESTPNVSSLSSRKLLPRAFHYPSLGVLTVSVAGGLWFGSEFNKTKNALIELGKVIDPDNDGIINTPALKEQWDQKYRESAKKRAWLYGSIGGVIAGAATLAGSKIERRAKGSLINKKGRGYAHVFEGDLKFRWTPNSAGIIYYFK